LVESNFHAKPLTHYRHQHINRDRDPYLSFHRVLAGSEKCLDAQVLFDPLEQQGDILPINIVPMKSRFTIGFIRCARTSFR
jgi:hypothetical protein